MNPVVVLALISELYEQLGTLRARNAELEQQVELATAGPGRASAPTPPSD